MLRLFAGHEAAVHRSGAIAEDCRFRLDELRYEYPKEVWEGEDPQARLERLTAKGLKWRYPFGVPERVAAQAAHELALIARLELRPLFPHRQRRGRLRPRPGHPLPGARLGGELGGLLRPRHHLGLPRDRHHGLRALRLGGPRRAARHRRRLRARAPRGGDPVHLHPLRPRTAPGSAPPSSTTAASGRSARSAPPWGSRRDTVAALSSQIWGWGGGGLPDERLVELGLDPNDRRLALTMELVDEIIGFPRHLSQHVGGFVITEGRLDELVPVENAAMEDRTVICWDKDDIDALGILKVDVLALGHAHLHPQGLRPARRAPRPRATRSRRCRPRIRRSTTCSAGPIRSASSRSRAGRR